MKKPLGYCLVKEIPENAILYTGSNARPILEDHELDPDIYNVWIDYQSKKLYTVYNLVPYNIDTAKQYHLDFDYWLD